MYGELYIVCFEELSCDRELIYCMCNAWDKYNRLWLGHTNIYVFEEETHLIPSENHILLEQERFSNNNSIPDFTDEELLTIYIFSMIEEEKYKVKSIHAYAEKYLHDWFPKLPSYQTFNNRLNRLAAVFPPLIVCLLKDVNTINTTGVRFDISLLDSMPIITCSVVVAKEVEK